jgi:hypothetical protein
MRANSERLAPPQVVADNYPPLMHTTNRAKFLVMGRFEGYGLQPVHKSRKNHPGFSP